MNGINLDAINNYTSLELKPIRITGQYYALNGFENAIYTEKKHFY
jgi:hypothetical protein